MVQNSQIVAMRKLGMTEDEISDIIEGKAQWYEPFDFYQLIEGEK